MADSIRPRILPGFVKSLPFFHAFSIVYKPGYRESAIAMIAQLLYWMTTKIRMIGYEKERTRFMVGFLVTSMVAVTVLFGIVRILQHTEWDRNTGRSTGYCRQHAALQYYAPIGIQG